MAKTIIVLFTLIFSYFPSYGQNSQFVETAINKKVEELKKRIAERQNYNKQVIDAAAGGARAAEVPGYTEALREEINRDTVEICSRNDLKNKLGEAVRVYCIPTDLKYMCEDYQAKSLQASQDLYRQSVGYLGGTEEVLIKYQTTLESVLRTTINYNDMCSSGVAKQIFSVTCKEAYEWVISSEIENQVAHHCTEHAIDQTIQEFKNTMQTVYIKVLDDIQVKHVKARELEGELAKKILEVRAQIHKLQKDKNNGQDRIAGLNN